MKIGSFGMEEDMEERLAEILEMAKADPALRQALLDTKKEKYPVHAFCEKIKELG